MRREYDFSKARRNLYAAKLKRSVTVRLDESTIDCFKALAEKTEIPYQMSSPCIFENALGRSVAYRSNG